MEKLQRLMKSAAELGFGKTDDWEAAFLQQAVGQDDRRSRKRMARERWRKLSWRVRNRTMVAVGADTEDGADSMAGSGITAIRQ